MANASDSVIPSEFTFLSDEHGFRESFRGRDYVELVGGNLRISFDLDRHYDSLSINLGSIHDKQKPGNFCIYFALPGVMQLVTKTDYSTTDPSVIDMASFLRIHLETLQSMFSAENLQKTKAALSKLSMEIGERLYPGKVVDLTGTNFRVLGDNR